MLEKLCDIWKSGAEAVCITTNGALTRAKRAVMGRGVAKQAKERYPDLEGLLGRAIKANGNVTQVLFHDQKAEFSVVSFPVKPDYGDNVLPRLKHIDRTERGYPGWACYADIGIITKSALRLVELADANGWQKVALVRPGCGNGGLSWSQVRPKLAAILDDRFVICSL